MDIRSLSAQQTYPLRQQILRPGMTREACRFAEDEQPASRHFGAFQDGKLLGIVTVLNIAEVNRSEQSTNDWQIRALATLPEVRGKGYAAALIRAVEDYVRTQKGRLLWCNARRSAVGFYLKQGYTVIGDEFEITAVGPHFRMKKIL